MLRRLLSYLRGNEIVRWIWRKVDWMVLSELGRSSLVRSFSIWIVIVPILAKMLDKLSDAASFSIFGASIVVTLALPFNLTIFYFCSLSFSIASLLYTLSCPPIIKKYRDFGEFMSKSGSIHLLVAQINKLDKTKKKGYQESYDYNELANDAINSQKLCELYEEVVKDVKLQNGSVRASLIILYSLSFGMLTWIFYENTIAVLEAQW